MRVILIACCATAPLLAAGCAAPTGPIAADDPFSTRVTSPNYGPANVRSGYYVDVGGGSTAPARLFVYQGPPRKP